MTSNQTENIPLAKFDPTECFGYKLNMITRVVNRIYSKHLKHLDTTINQVNLLYMLSKKDGIYQVDLAKVLCLDLSTISRELDRLVKKQYVEKTGYANKPNLMLTKNGRMFIKQTLPFWRNAQEEIKTIVSSKNTDSLDQIIGKIRS